MRREFKGQANNNESLRLLCKIRHEHTNYNKLTIFYKLYPKKRSELNSAINKLIKVGPDGIDEFKKKVKSIEDYVNLNRKESKKRFIQERIIKLKQENPTFMDSLTKKCAEAMLAKYIRKNNNYINKIKECNNDNTEFD